MSTWIPSYASPTTKDINGVHAKVNFSDGSTTKGPFNFDGPDEATVIRAIQAEKDYLIGLDAVDTSKLTGQVDLDSIKPDAATVLGLAYRDDVLKLRLMKNAIKDSVMSANDKPYTDLVSSLLGRFTSHPEYLKYHSGLSV